MPQVGFIPTIPASERAKTVHALDRAATVIGRVHLGVGKFKKRETWVHLQATTEETQAERKK
jgi:hypothetical protein